MDYSRKDKMIEYLSNENEQLISLAYLYARNAYYYGVDITKAMNTAIEQNRAMHEAYCKGYSDAMLKVNLYNEK